AHSKKGSGEARAFRPLGSDGLLEAVLHRGEVGLEVATNALHDADDRDRDAGGNQAILDGGRTGLIVQETLEGLHRLAPLACAHGCLNLDPPCRCSRPFWIVTQAMRQPLAARLISPTNRSVLPGIVAVVNDACKSSRLAPCRRKARKHLRFPCRA